MHKLLTQKTNDDPAWDSRDYSLTLLGCLAVAGMPLPEPKPKTRKTVQVLLANGTVVKKKFTCENKAETFAAACRQNPLTSLVTVR